MASDRVNQINNFARNIGLLSSPLGMASGDKTPMWAPQETKKQAVFGIYEMNKQTQTAAAKE